MKKQKAMKEQIYGTNTRRCNRCDNPVIKSADEGFLAYCLSCEMGLKGYETRPDSLTLEEIVNLVRETPMLFREPYRYFFKCSKEDDTGLSIDKCVDMCTDIYSCETFKQEIGKYFAFPALWLYELNLIGGNVLYIYEINYYNHTIFAGLNGDNPTWKPVKIIDNYVYFKFGEDLFSLEEFMPFSGFDKDYLCFEPEDDGNPYPLCDKQECFKRKFCNVSVHFNEPL